MHIEIFGILLIGGLIHGAHGCGERKINLPSGIQYIVRGSYARHGYWPWQVDLRTIMERSWRGTSYSSCGASILNKEWLVTAAHCVAQKGTTVKDIEVRLGSNSKKNEGENGEIKMGIKRRIIHPKYVHGAQPIIDDIALLQLERPITFSKTIQPICLPTKKAKEGQSCTATGWGRDEGGSSRRSSDKLKKASYSIKYSAFANYAVCNKYQPSTLCAGSTSSICQGDSGGPLACKVGNRYVLYGVVSWVGADCRNFKLPSGFADVYHFLPWIKKYIGSTGSGGSPNKPSPPKKPCVNKKSQCNKWASRGYCKWLYPGYMKKNCRLACGYCNGQCKHQKCKSYWGKKCSFSTSKCRCVCRWGK